MSRMAHIELAIRDGIAVNLGDVIFYVNNGVKASHGDVQKVNQPKKGWNQEQIDLFFSDSSKINLDYKTYLESHIMLGFSGVSRHSEVQAKKKVDNIKEGKTDSLLLETAELANEAIEMLAKEKEMFIIGDLLDKAWNIKRNLADGVTEKWIDDIYYSAIEHGAYGGKLMGAGGGGFFMFLVPPKYQKEFKEKMYQIKVWVPFKFDNDGSQIILDNS